MGAWGAESVGTNMAQSEKKESKPVTAIFGRYVVPSISVSNIRASRHSVPLLLMLFCLSDVLNGW